jgi:hypothetical protein
MDTLTTASQALTAAVAQLGEQQARQSPAGAQQGSGRTLLLAGSCLAAGAALGLLMRRSP